MSADMIALVCVVVFAVLYYGACYAAYRYGYRLEDRRRKGRAAD